MKMGAKEPVPELEQAQARDRAGKHQVELVPPEKINNHMII